MKLRVLFLKRVHIIYLILIIVSLIIVIAATNTKKEPTVVFSVNEKGKILKYDLTGDGSEDLLYIDSEKDQYYIQVNSKKKVYTLNPNKELNTLGNYSSSCPMKLKLQDITRDNIPEIFIQSVDKKTNVQHVFTWTGKDFKDIFCADNNLLGILDVTNNKTPKFLSGKLSGGKMNYSYYMYINGKVENISDDSQVPGELQVSSFINYVQSLPDGKAYKPDNVFNPGMDGKSLELISKIAGDKKIYKFTNAIFTDTKSDKNGAPSQFNWILNFSSTSMTDFNDVGNISISIKLKRLSSSNDEFRIYYIGQAKN